MEKVYHNIVCPKCRSAQNVEVPFVKVDGISYPQYLKKCNYCGYVIKENEWNAIEISMKEGDKTIISHSIDIEKPLQRKKFYSISLMLGIALGILLGILLFFQNIEL